jgi:hypothetical protein
MLHQQIGMGFDDLGIYCGSYGKIPGIFLAQRLDVIHSESLLYVF